MKSLFERVMSISIIDTAPLILLMVGLLLGVWGIIDGRLALTIISIILILHAIEIRLILLVFIAIMNNRETGDRVDSGNPDRARSKGV